MSLMVIITAKTILLLHLMCLIGIKDTETHLLQTWLAGCSDKELFNDAILALNSYRFDFFFSLLSTIL